VTRRRGGREASGALKSLARARLIPHHSLPTFTNTPKELHDGFSRDAYSTVQSRALRMTLSLCFL
jgi:hypothetical protein